MQFVGTLVLSSVVPWPKINIPSVDCERCEERLRGDREEATAILTAFAGRA